LHRFTSPIRNQDLPGRMAVARPFATLIVGRADIEVREANLVPPT
jgi:hypothetical protein